MAPYGRPTCCIRAWLWPRLRSSVPSSPAGGRPAYAPRPRCGRNRTGRCGWNKTGRAGGIRPVREGDEAALARRQVQAVAATAVAVLAAVGGLACLASSAGESFSGAGAVLEAVLDHLRGG